MSIWPDVNAIYGDANDEEQLCVCVCVCVCVLSGLRHGKCGSSASFQVKMLNRKSGKGAWNSRESLRLEVSIWGRAV